MRVESHGGMILTGETETLGGKPVAVPFCLRQIPYGPDPGANPGLRRERPETNRLSHLTAQLVC
jgi:hypothetical protein